MKKTSKIIAILIIAVMLLGLLPNNVNATIEFTETEIEDIINVDDINSTKFMPYVLLTVFGDHSVAGKDELIEHFLADIEKDKTNLEEKGIILSSVGLKDGKIEAKDAQQILSIAFGEYDINEGNYVAEMIKNDIIQDNKEFNVGDIEVKTTIEIPDSLVEIASSRLDKKLDNKVFDGSNSVTISSKDSDLNTKMSKIESAIAAFAVEIIGDDADETDVSCATISVKAIAKIENDTITYTLTLGKDFNWYLVPDKLPKKDEPKQELKKEFSTEIKYAAEIDGKDVGQNTKYKEENKIDSSVFCPGFDEKQPAKDADVTVTINSKTDLPILKTNDVALTDDGKPNSEGWYYVDTKDKKVIAKLYKFDDYNNLQDNGIVVEPKLSLTSEDNLTDEQKVAITWPFRIIDVKYDPTEITEKTDKVTVTITTNLPMDKDKVPAGWAFTTDDEGKTQHRIFKIYEKKDGNIDETITVKQNGTPVTASTPVKITWKETLSPVIPQTGATLTITVVLVILTICGIVALKKYRK